MANDDWVADVRRWCASRARGGAAVPAAPQTPRTAGEPGPLANVEAPTAERRPGVQPPPANDAR